MHIGHLSDSCGSADRGMHTMMDTLFPPGTPVQVKETIRRRGVPLETQVIGLVEAWEDLPTGSWYANGKDDKLWLKRLRLRKADGEVTLLVIDDLASIAKLEAV